jgi:hypothetical protein
MSTAQPMVYATGFGTSLAALGFAMTEAAKNCDVGGSRLMSSWRFFMHSIRMGAAAILLLMSFAETSPSHAQGNDGFQIITDESTGVSIGLPSKILTTMTITKRGRNWSSRDSKINVDTLAYVQEDLKSLYDRLRQIKGRTLTRSEWTETAFVLAGQDSDGRSFHVEMHQNAGEIRGFSVVYPSSQKAKMLVDKIARSFNAFPGSGRVTGSPALPQPAVAAEAPTLPTPAAGSAKADAVACHLKTDSGGAIDATVGVKESATSVRTGDPITIEWKVAPGFDLACRTPLYLVLTTPMRTRFEGEKFLAIPPGPEGPFGITYGQDRTRVFIPLHLGPRQQQGELVVKVFEAGPFVFDWAAIEVPKLTRDPQTRMDLAVGRERVTTPVALGSEMTVVGGRPAIVVRDQFSIETPKEIVRSNSGEFELQVFDSFYRVLDAKTGELLQERAGWDPNFSPGSRFLGAYSAGLGLEIIDLYSGTVVTSNDILHRERGFRGNVHMVAWSPGDIILALSIQGYGGIEVQQTLVDGSQRSFPDTSCHHCRGIGSALRVDNETGIVSFQGQETGWASLFDRTVGTAAAKAYALKQVPERADEEQRRMDLLRRAEPLDAAHLPWVQRESVMQAASARMLASLAQAGFFRPKDAVPDSDHDKAAEPVEQNWRFPDPMQVSHLCLELTDGKCVGRLADWQDVLADPEDENARLAKTRVMHKRLASSIPASVGARGGERADARLIGMRGERNGQRGREADTLWSRLAQLLSEGKADATLSPISRGVSAADETKGNEGVLAAIVRAIPKARAALRASSKGDFVEPDDVAGDTYYGLKNEAKLIDPRLIRQVATWRVGDQSYWLIHAFFDNGASSRNWLFLLHGSKNGASQLVDLTHRLRYRVGRTPSGLDQHGKIEITEEFATTMGFGGWPASFDRVSVAFNRYLIASGLWTIDWRRWVLVYDLATNQIRFFNRDVPEAATFAESAVTEDGHTLVQINSNGHLFFYDVGSEKLLLRGFDIDDELVIYDPQGYYAASTEGAHFVFLKFPGLPGYNSFHQFASTLHRPDLIRAVLGNKVDTPDPKLTPPPKVGLDVNVSGAASSRAAKLNVTAESAVGLQKMQVFVDGRLSGEYPMTGGSATMAATVPLSPEARWLTAVAVDAKGYESVARGRDLPGAGQATASRLFAIAVGTDRYDDENDIEQLASAKSDALSFANSVKGLARNIYGNVEVTSYLDATGLRESLPAAIRKVVAEASDRDTIMLFAAGHGFLDKSTGQFFLATRESRVDRLTETSIAWTEIAAALVGARARIIVFLDACHSGAAGTGGTNDDAVSALLSRNESITLIAASKGRQSSQELGAGGVFTTALVEAITAERQKTDSNANGVIELAELYAAVKRDVVARTQGAQTPWIARNLMVGEIPLF